MHVKSCRGNVFFFFSFFVLFLWLAKYFSSSPLPAWTWCSVYTCGANWRVWIRTITRLHKKPTEKEITTTRQFRKTNNIAKIKSFWGQKCHNSFEWGWRNAKNKTNTFMGLIPLVILNIYFIDLRIFLAKW